MTVSTSGCEIYTLFGILPHYTIVIRRVLSDGTSPLSPSVVISHLHIFSFPTHNKKPSPVQGLGFPFRQTLRRRLLLRSQYPAEKISHVPVLPHYGQRITKRINRCACSIRFSAFLIRWQSSTARGQRIKKKG